MLLDVEKAKQVVISIIHIVSHSSHGGGREKRTCLLIASRVRAGLLTVLTLSSWPLNFPLTAQGTFIIRASTPSVRGGLPGNHATHF